MPSATLVPSKHTTELSSILPQILKTPSGVALVELQGTVHRGQKPLAKSSLELDLGNEEDHNGMEEDNDNSGPHLVGTIDFGDDGKSATLIVGKHQRLIGKIVKLKNPLAVLQMAGPDVSELGPTQLSQGAVDNVDIPIIEVVTHKVVFDKRPEPVVYD